MEKPQNTKSQKTTVTIKVAVVVLLIDAIVNSLYSAYTFALPREYLHETSSFYFLRFFRDLGFGTLIYINKVLLVYIILILLFAFLIKFVKKKQIYYVILGVSIAFFCYFFYAYNWSVNHFRDHFSYFVFWYSFLGGLYGWVYFKKYFTVTQQ